MNWPDECVPCFSVFSAQPQLMEVTSSFLGIPLARRFQKYPFSGNRGNGPQLHVRPRQCRRAKDGSSKFINCHDFAINAVLFIYLLSLHSNHDFRPASARPSTIPCPILLALSIWLESLTGMIRQFHWTEVIVNSSFKTQYFRQYYRPLLHYLTTNAR